MPHYLHYIDHSGLHSHRVQRDTLQRVQAFAAGDEGATQFAQWLPTQPRGLHTVLADLADEGFHLDSIPHVIGRDRRELIQRRLTQQFFGSPYATAVSLGRERSGRRDERLLLTAITRGTLIDPWLTVLRQHEAPLAALYTVPLLTRELARQISQDLPRGLILLLSSSGIRQIYFDEGKLRFSRLAHPPEGPMARWGLDCLREAQKTCQYLHAQRWLPRTASVPVILLANRQDGAALLGDISRASQSDDKLIFQLGAIEALRRKLGLHSAADSSDARDLLMQLALRERGHGVQLAPASERRFYRLWQIRFAALAGSALVLAGSALAAGKWAVDAHVQRSEAGLLRSEAALQEARYRALLDTLPQMPTSLDSLRATVDNIERLQTTLTDPRAALSPLARTLDAHPDISLDRLEWRQADWDPERAPDLNQSGARHSLTIHATLAADSAGDPRTALTRIQTFTTDLARQSGGKVRIIQQPYDTSSDKSLRSDLGSSGQRPAFRLQVDWPGERP